MLKFSITVRWRRDDPYRPDIYELEGSHDDSDQVKSLLDELVDEGLVDSYAIEQLPSFSSKIADILQEIREQSEGRR
jgi:hypothetical protein